MKKTGYILFLAAALIITIIAPAFADIQIFVRNRPYSGELVKDNNLYYVNLEEFAKALSYNLKNIGGAWYLANPDSPYTDKLQEGVKPEKGIKVYLEGKPFAGILERKDKLYVELEGAAKALGCYYKQYKELNMIDIALPRLNRPPSANPSNLKLGQTRFTLVFYYTDWDRWSQKMLAQIESFKRLAGNRVTVILVNYDKKNTPEYKLYGEKVAVLGYPTSAFLDGNGTVMKVIPGYIEAPVLLEYVRALEQ